MKKTLYIYSIALLLFLNTAPEVSATLMQGENFRLKTDTFQDSKQRATNDTGKNLDNEKKEDLTNNQTKKEQDNSISISLNPTSLEFGILTAGEPLQRTLNINAQADQGFTLQISQNHTLTSGSHKIPGTTCDNGSCTTSISSKWVSPLVFGFGYTCSTKIPCSGFSDTQYFKPIADTSQENVPQPFFSAFDPKITELNLTFKVNIPPTEAGLEYNNNITVIALPNY